MQRLISPAGRGANGGSAAPDGRASNRLRVLQALLPYVWPSRPAGPQDHRRGLAGADAGGQARHRRHALHLQVGDGRAGGRHRAATSRPRRPLPWLVGAPVLAILLYGAGARCHVAAGAGARRHVRQGCPARRAQARAQHLRAHAPALAALPPGAQDRRPHARARARPARHREHHAHDADDVRADDRRVRAGAGACCCSSSTGAMRPSSPA